MLEVDASEVGVGAILSQRFGEPPKLYLCAFYSRKLSSTEWNYDILLPLTPRQLGAAGSEAGVGGMEALASAFTVITDHKNLLYIQA